MSSDGQEECIRVRHSQYRFFLWNEDEGGAGTCTAAIQLGYKSYDDFFKDEMDGPTFVASGSVGLQLCSGDPFIATGRRVRVVENALSAAHHLPFTGLLGTVVSGGGDGAKSGFFRVRLDVGGLELSFNRSNILDLSMEAWFESQTGKVGSYEQRIIALAMSIPSNDRKRRRAAARGVGAQPSLHTEEEPGDGTGIAAPQGGGHDVAAPATSNMMRQGVATFLRHMRLQQAGFKCGHCQMVFCADTALCLDMAHRAAGRKAETYQRYGIVDRVSPAGLHAMGQYMPTQAYILELWEHCEVLCVGCHRYYDNCEQQREGARQWKELTGQRKQYAEWRAKRCQYGSDPEDRKSVV